MAGSQTWILARGVHFWPKITQGQHFFFLLPSSFILHPSPPFRVFHHPSASPRKNLLLEKTTIVTPKAPSRSTLKNQIAFIYGDLLPQFDLWYGRQNTGQNRRDLAPRSICY